MTTIITTPQSSDLITGTMNAVSDTISVATPNDVTGVGFQISGTFVATVIFEGTIDGTTWFPVNAYSGVGASVASLTAPGQAIIASGCLSALRVRCSGYTSGTINVVANNNCGWLGSPALSPVQISNGTTTADTLAAISGVITTTKTLAVAVSPYNSGILTHTLNSAATTNATSVKTTAGTLYTLLLANLSASTRYFKLYLKASAPTVGTDIPIMTFIVPAGTTLSAPLSTFGLRCGTGIAYAITGAAVDTDTTAIAAGDVKVALSYA